MAADREVLRERLHALGFDVVRFARVDGDSPGADAFERWLDSGHQADMAWMERSRAKRRDVTQVQAGATTLVMLGVNYAPAPAVGAAAVPAEDGGGTGVWARYALHDDYHDSIKPGLVAAGQVLEQWGGISGADYRYYVDTGPVLERSWAARAGVGFTGKNAMLISREFGNWLFLAAIVVGGGILIEPDAPVSRAAADRPVGTLCGSCTACLEACPTQALVAPGELDARRCISYHTIENRGIIPRAMRRGIGDRLYGCDICAEVCPWNRFAQASKSLLLNRRPELAALSLEEILTLTPERFAAVFKGTAVKRLKLRGLLRNACIVAANTGALACRPALWRLAAESEWAMVRAHAVAALRELGATLDELAALRGRETDAAVLAEFGEPTP
ncbi:tRNA epoxyqueuosine(34) reductase QueG [Actomonas aquatica]|uniref:tRNA epoxyqueuosine(34) reductase QueG n=1 Tax=Actomonas aquatica TaxID=2866162 RepID=A0ABZ1CA27_9BACT|nr:tRNA epoxyqueuosine(34) reductase QueG [Opitutus sp. WL0086]WRQ88542.1 tRNA epoxyqueuosine(34) reductase QueG [Opitutus sp. WL0086]